MTEGELIRNTLYEIEANNVNINDYCSKRLKAADYLTFLKLKENLLFLIRLMEIREYSEIMKSSGETWEWYREYKRQVMSAKRKMSRMQKRKEMMVPESIRVLCRTFEGKIIRGNL